MTDYEKLKARLRETPFLVADLDGTVELSNQSSTFKTINESAFASSCIMNLKRSLVRFSNLKGVGKDGTFSMKQIGKIMGVSYQVVWLYKSEGILTPSIKAAGGPGMGENCEAVYSWVDGFVAGILGSLRRHGINMETLKKVQPLFVGKKKRIGQRPAISNRS